MSSLPPPPSPFVKPSLLSALPAVFSGRGPDWWLGVVAIVLEFGLLSMLWNELPGVPAIVWTGSATVLMAAFVARNPTRFEDLGPLAAPTLIFLALYPLLCVLSHALQPQVQQGAVELLYRNALQMFLGAVLFVFGVAVRRQRLDEGFLLAFLATTVYALLNSERFTTQSIYERLQDLGAGTDYQHLGDTFVISTLILSTRLLGLGRFALFAALALVVMFLIPSRSAAVLGAICLPVYVLLSAPSRLRAQILLALTAGMVLILSLPLQDLFEGTRFESFFVSTPDSSLSMREEIFSRGLDVIALRPLTGAWAFQLDAFASSGLYVHNALDVWVQAGLIAFLLFLYPWWRAAVVRVQAWGSTRTEAVEVLPILLFAALSWITSRNVGYVLPFFCLGYASAGLAAAWRLRRGVAPVPAS